LTVQNGILGAAYGWLLSNIVVSASLWFQFLILVSRSVEGQNSVHVLRDFRQEVNSRDVEITRLGEGGESHIYSARTKNGEPICELANSVVLKIYKSNEPTSLEEVRRQFEALAKLNEKLD